MKGFAACSTLAALLLLGAGCNGGSDKAVGTVQLAAASQPPSSSDSAPWNLAPASNTYLELTVKQVAFHVAMLDDADDAAGSGDDRGTIGKPTEDESESDGGWVTMDFGQKLDLRAGANQIALGSVVVPAGRLTQIRLVLDGDAVVYTALSNFDIACPSCSTSGLKLLVDNDVEIPAGGAVNLTLMFDLEKTALQAAAGSKLGPVVHVEASLAP